MSRMKNQEVLILLLKHMFTLLRISESDPFLVDSSGVKDTRKIIDNLSSDAELTYPVSLVR